MGRELYEDIIAQFGGKKILAIGDVYLDEYMLGEVIGISEEAPVPVLAYGESIFTPGAMANVANNVNALGADVTLVGVIGSDEGARRLTEELRNRSIKTDGLFEDAERPTTHKIKVMAGSSQRAYQHVYRIDKESRQDISRELEQQIMAFLDEAIPEADAVIISDYRNGVITPELLPYAIKTGRKHNKIVTADSRGNLLDYKNVTIITPNVTEVENTLNASIETDDAIIVAGKALMERLQSDSVLITCGKDGMWLFEKDIPPVHMPAVTREEVADVTGAGDTVLATLTVALTCGATMREAATLSNYAAGICVRKLGAATVSPDEISSSIERMS
jgi:rfaE bifunctional protein kinase chain/domain